MKKDQHLIGRDERLTNICAYCGGEPETTDHVPSKVLLDRPFPDDLHAVDACLDCNQSFSLDEEYLACLLESVLAGTADPQDLPEGNARRILTKRPALASRIQQAKQQSETGPVFSVENERVENTILKLARGHAVFLNTELQLDEPSILWFVPRQFLTESELVAFEDVSGSGGWPELGSRAFYEIVERGELGWINVQNNVYRYALGSSGSIDVRIVLREYLYAQVAWD